ncbi:MAG: universal stress protein [Tepidisphaerales bacterium]
MSEPGRPSRILVAVSSALAAERMATPVADLATRLGAEVLVVHVSRPSAGQLREQELADGEAALAELRLRLQQARVPVQTLLLFSDEIATALLNTARERECTLICAGLSGKNIFVRLLSGNVPVELIRQTRLPVLLLPPDTAAL